MEDSPGRQCCACLPALNARAKLVDRHPGRADSTNERPRALPSFCSSTKPTALGTYGSLFAGTAPDQLRSPRLLIGGIGRRSAPRRTGSGHLPPGRALTTAHGTSDLVEHSQPLHRGRKFHRQIAGEEMEVLATDPLRDE